MDVEWLQILEVEGVAVPEDVPRILQVVSDYLKASCPITSLSSSQGPAQSEGKHPLQERREAQQVKLHTGPVNSISMLTSGFRSEEKKQTEFLLLQGEPRVQLRMLP